LSVVEFQTLHSAKPKKPAGVAEPHIDDCPRSTPVFAAKLGLGDAPYFLSDTRSQRAL